MTKIGITQGDINGIGYEVILKALDDPQILEICTPVIYGSLKLASHYRKLLGLQKIPHVTIDSAADARPGVVNVINTVGEDTPCEPGVPTPESGAAALAALERAVAELSAGLIDALVTAPIDKANIQADSFRFSGHTEYLQDRIGGKQGRALMIMADSLSGLRVALATTHLPITQVPSALSHELIVSKIHDLNDSLIRDFGCHYPRIAVLALNPHAGDDGLLGREEQDIIIPAIEATRRNHIEVYGPYPADGFFGAGHQKQFDGILAMYHDQGLIPFKTLSGDTGVNFTAGLPYVRTSPDHGTAFDIAGKGEADPQSMRSAIYAAIDALRCRANHDDAVANPLKKLYQERINNRE